MQETVTTATERKSLLSSFLDVLEAQGKAAQAERQVQEERYRRRTQRIYDYHDRQRREVVELRRCLDYVSQHARVLETVLRGAGTAGGANGTEEVPLSFGLVRQAAALQRCMAQCVANAAQIRAMLAATHQPQMDNMLAKMSLEVVSKRHISELCSHFDCHFSHTTHWVQKCRLNLVIPLESELRSWTAFLHRAVDATYNSEIVIDNLHNMIAEQRRYVREVSSSSVFTALCSAEADAETDASAGVSEAAETQAVAEAVAEADADADRTPRSPLERRPASSCSTPIHN